MSASDPVCPLPMAGPPEPSALDDAKPDSPSRGQAAAAVAATMAAPPTPPANRPRNARLSTPETSSISSVS
ncbi:MAG: hypothetical protein ACSLFB_07030 [Acidimicrobiales bacterium]